MNPNMHLNAALEGRKFELANAVSILSLVSSVPLNTTMSPAQHSAALKDKLAALSAENVVNVNRINQIADKLFTAINNTLGTSYSMADIDAGTISSTALIDAIKANVGQQKLVIFARLTVPVIASSASRLIDISSVLGYADSTDWSLPENGGFGAPYNTTTPVPTSVAFTQETRVDVIYTTSGSPVLDASDNTVVGYINIYQPVTTQVNVVWGYLDKNDHMFYPANFPASLAGGVDVVIPVKTNLADAPADFLGMTRGGVGLPGVSGSLAGIEDILAANKLTINTNVEAVVGSGLTAAAFASVTANPILNPGGYISIVAGLLDLLAKNKATQDIIIATDAFVGKAVGDITPNYSLLGDARDYVAVGDTFVAAISKINAALVAGNVLTVGGIGANFPTINAALVAINGGAVSAPTDTLPLVLKLQPGVYNESVVLQDHVYIVGSGIECTKINGVVEIPNRVGTSFGVKSNIMNVALNSSSASTLLITADGEYALHALSVENTGGGAALRIQPASGVKVELAANVALISLAGQGLSLNQAEVISHGASVAAHDGARVELGSQLNIRSGEFVCSGDGVAVDATSSCELLTGHIQAGNRGIFTTGGLLSLLGGFVSGTNKAIVANSLSSVVLGAVNVLGSSVIWGGANIVPRLIARSLFVEDFASLFLADNLEDVLAEIGGRLNTQQSAISVLQTKSSFNEHDALVDAAMIQVGSMSTAYTLFMVDSFMTPSTNIYPDGVDKALVDAQNSVLMHQGASGSFNYYKQNFDGDMVTKQRIHLKTALQKSAADGSGNGDWQIQFFLDISGGRYSANPISYLLTTFTNSNFVDRFEKEYVLSELVATPIAALSPIIAAGETVALRIAIKADTAMSEATPMLRSFVAFM